MKKYISAAMAAILTFSAAAPFASLAEDELYIPRFYMALRESGKVSFQEDGTVVIDRSVLENGLTLSADIFFEDDTLSAWSVSPRWRATTGFIEITPYDPLERGGDPPYEFAYSEKNDNGELVFGAVGSDLSRNKAYNSVNFTCRRMDGKSMEPYGGKSSDFPLINFDMEISPNIPYGDYEIEFITARGNNCRAAMNYGSKPIFGSDDMPLPITENMKLRVVGSNIGDVNNDGAINASDASRILAEYAASQTGKESILSDIQREAADVDNDGAVNASDASDILNYYAYSSTTTDAKIKSFKEYFGR